MDCPGCWQTIEMKDPNEVILYCPFCAWRL